MSSARGALNGTRASASARQTTGDLVPELGAQNALQRGPKLFSGLVVGPLPTDGVEVPCCSLSRHPNLSCCAVRVDDVFGAIGEFDGDNVTLQLGFKVIAIGSSRASMSKRSSSCAKVTYSSSRARGLYRRWDSVQLPVEASVFRTLVFE